MPIYEEKNKKNGKVRYYIRTYITDLQGNCKQVTRRNINWVGREGKILAQQEELKLKLLQSGNIEKDITVEKATNIFLQHIKPTIKLRTFKKKEDDFRLHIIPYFGKRKVSSLTTNDITCWKNKMMNLTYKKGKTTNSYSWSFRQHLYIVFNEFMDFCAKNYGINNVVSTVGGFKRCSNDYKEKEFLTEEEFLRAIDTEDNIIYKQLLTVMFYTGLRLGELGALKPQHIDLDRNIIFVKDNLWQKAPDEELKIGKPKTRHSDRIVIILDEIIPIFTKLISERSEEEFVFGKARYIPETNIRRHLNNCVARAGINKHITPHCLRHSFITMCAFKNIPVDIVSKMVGHGSITTTYNIYTHVNEERLLTFKEYFNQTRPKQDQF